MQALLCSPALQALWGDAIMQFKRYGETNDHHGS